MRYLNGRWLYGRLMHRRLVHLAGDWDWGLDMLVLVLLLMLPLPPMLRVQLLFWDRISTGSIRLIPCNLVS